MSKSVVPVPYGVYVEVSRFAAMFVAAVAAQLHNAMPADASAEERGLMNVVLASADAVAVVLIERARLGVGRVRPAVIAFSNAWSACSEVLGGFARIEGPSGDDARMLVATLFHDGVGFVKLDARAGWAAGVRQLTRIDGEGLAPKLESIIGAAMLAHIRATTASLGNAIGAGPTHVDAPSSTALAEKVADFASDVAAYARLLAAKVDERDPASVARFLKAMAPLDEYRASRRGVTDDESDDETAAPVVANGASTPALPSPFIST
jgi:hypothetical protein